MPPRKIIFADGEYYHIYNRSAGGEQLFTKIRDNNRLLDLIDYYRFPVKLRFSKFHQLPNPKRNQYWNEVSKLPQLVMIFAFCLMPNHYHLVIKQLTEEGLRSFITNVQNSYARYYNTKYHRNGSLFQNPFKAVHIDSNEQFIHIVRYVHINPLTSYLIKREALTDYPWTSYKWYSDKENNRFIDREEIINHFGTIKRFQAFTNDNVDYQQKLAKIKYLRID